MKLEDYPPNLTSKQALTVASTQLNSALDARLILQHVLGLSHEQLILNDHKTLTPEQLERFFSQISRRANNEPLAYILGYKEFWGRNFLVDYDTLIPRADSETLIEAALSLPFMSNQSLKILDLGTGSGCLLLTLLAEFPNASGIGADQNPKALQIATQNAEKLALSERAELIISDWFSALSPNNQFDIIIANPPYIAESFAEQAQKELTFEPVQALYSGSEGLSDYQKIIPELSAYLKPSGYFIGELGYDQYESLVGLFAKTNLTFVKKLQDLADITRCIVYIKQYNLE